MLMSDKNVDIKTDAVNEIIETYTRLDLRKYFLVKRDENEEDTKDRVGNLIYLYSKIRKEISSLNSNINYIVDVLIEYLYNYKQSSFKTTLWECFGDVIVENLKYNIVMNQVYCEVCGDLIERKQ